jgi:molecular chaperone GrpE
MKQLKKEKMENPINNNQEAIDQTMLLKNQIEHLEKQCMYLKSDLENVRRTMIREIEAQTQKKEHKILTVVINLIDNLERFFEAHKNNPDIKVMEKTIHKAIQELSLEEVKTDISFDPTVHEALTFIQTEDSSLDEKIQAVSQKGYTYKNILIKPAQVVVYKKN